MFLEINIDYIFQEISRNFYYRLKVYTGDNCYLKILEEWTIHWKVGKECGFSRILFRTLYWILCIGVVDCFCFSCCCMRLSLTYVRLTLNSSSFVSSFQVLLLNAIATMEDWFAQCVITSYIIIEQPITCCY